MTFSKNSLADDLATPARIGVSSTPALSLDLDAVDHNIATMAAWCAQAAVDLAPHGKTTMMPDIWRRQLDAGAWGITVATAFQAEIARDAGVPNIIMAGTAFAPEVLRSLLDGPADVLMWIDSLAGVHLLNDALSGTPAPARPLAILVEFGSVLGRTGARSVEEATQIADAVHAAEHLVLAGVAGYEGALTHGIDDAGIAIIDGYLRDLLEVLDTIPASHFAPWLDSGRDVVLTAGGSVYFDRVAAVLGGRHDPRGERGGRARVVLRSGSYVAHDHDLYRRLTPFARIVPAGASTSPHAESLFEPPTFEPALELWATVISRPQPDLALLNIGRRDAAHDEGFPIPLDVWTSGAQMKRGADALDGAAVTALNDQHAFLHLSEHSPVAVGDLVRLGISHPCTTFDKWTEIALVRGLADHRDQPPVIEGYLPTRF